MTNAKLLLFFCIKSEKEDEGGTFKDLLLLFGFVPNLFWKNFAEKLSLRETNRQFSFKL